jgi:predicted metalloendopeptidase
MRYCLIAGFAVGLAFAAGLRANIDPKNFDPAAKPQADFYEFASGGWIKANPVPAAYSSWGAFDEVDEHNKIALHQILENAAKADHRSRIEQQVGDFYASGMDETAIEAAGITPLQPELDRLAKITTITDVQAAIARLHRIRVNAGFFFTAEQDPKNSVMMIATGGQAGLGLPDRDYYFRDDDKSKLLREQYVAHVARMLELAGDPLAATQAEARAVMKLETALAKGSKTEVELRDPVANYHKMPQADLQKLTPRFDWKAYFAGLGLAQPGEIDVGQPEFIGAFDAALSATPIADWQAYLRWHLIHAAAPCLNAAVVNENFDFFGRKLTGRQQLRDRWKRVLETVDGGIGAVIGHEMTHGFDDEGRQFDAHGNLTDWWSPECAARFKERSQAIVKQFSAYVAIDDLHINGELTQGENIADLGGVKLGYAALQKALAGQPRAAVEGYTPEQRFFLSWATVWHESVRPEAARLQVNTDPHSPAQFRVNGPLSNLAEFAAAFNVPEGAAMRRPAGERVVIW